MLSVNCERFSSGYFVLSRKFGLPKSRPFVSEICGDVPFLAVRGSPGSGSWLC